MLISREQLEKEAVELPPVARTVGHLADKLVERLNGIELDEVQREWAETTIRRRDEIRAGASEPIPGDQVLAEARRAAAR